MNYQNIFISGSTGVVGKPLIRKIVENGHSVYALSRSGLHNQFFKDLNITKIEGDYVVLEVNNNLTLKFQKVAVHAVLPKGTIKAI